MDIKDYYYVAGEYMDCHTGGCNSTCISWDQRIISQLPDSARARFPAILTYKCACDMALVSLMRARTMGNRLSPTALRMNVLEVHSEEWLKKQLMYLGDCARAKRGQDLGLPPTE